MTVKSKNNEQTKGEGTSHRDLNLRVIDPGGETLSRGLCNFTVTGSTSQSTEYSHHMIAGVYNSLLRQKPLKIFSIPFMIFMFPVSK